ncbi:RNA polymerase sigma-54 factor [Burkholderia stabilis]|uniref:RNA polymerase factor sigma-54 n=1 Tax=Burkholderia stabilis TaxID=95485 RepID=UPI000851D2EB|nr:RNA polymerase factor sigma-54 [Burkholderia stabilis]AOR73037.1 RNA polymerase sigma-54 factor [Burkholderia stabilis]HDR9490030.1 RNA polymerase factor sigma-54 [Burkholderia stabilis]HDR9521584.1 RNA polymerase factor sigma-54 [Burkholderia stabilis]HDR9537135.1 RNA polymerase factor sigma-54 [Burkholderia stabilis]HDR9575081.1 RNA polymerase factor sigma-54 [Burkholderia stabilis]
MSVTLALQMRQHLALTPRLQQSLRLLQLSSLEFQQELRQALYLNPFLEDGLSDDETAAEPAVQAAEAAVPEATPEVRDDVRPPDGEVPYTAAPAPRGSGSQHDDAGGLLPGEWMAAEPSLHQQLHDALRLYPLNRRDREAARIVIDALDDDGYLRQELPELVAAADPALLLSEQDLAVALRLVQMLDRPGIAARSLSECLMLQLDAMPAGTPALAEAKAIAREHLERLARRETAEIQRRVGCHQQALHAACALVRGLDPRPGDHYGSTRGDYVVPDVIVRQVRDDWIVTINPAVLPRARLHERYATLFAQSSGERDSPLGQQLQEARWLIRNVQKRFDTIQRVGECIVARQRDFFRYGEIAMKPLVLRDIAEELDLHESTVSRATGNKYMATPHGTFEFKHFFPRKLEVAGKGVCSASAAKVLIRDMIAAERHTDPLSDVTLAQNLAGRGILLARRTVTKYRQAMKIPAADLRRRDAA